MPFDPHSTDLPYWIFARDSKGRVADLDTPAEVEAWFDGFEATTQTLTLMCGEDEVGEINVSVVADADELIEAIGEMPAPHSQYGQTFDELYTRGDCDVFAVALQAIIGGELYAITDPYDDKGERIDDDAYPYLVHAGVYDGDLIYDIRGSSELDYWSMTWRENGGCTMEGSTEDCDAEWLQKCQSTTHTAEEIAQATKIAWLIAGLTGALDDEKLATYRSLRATQALAA